MAAKRNIPEAWKNQWSKFMFNFFDYLPTKYEANKREWSIRRMIWDFKDGKRSASVAELVAKKMREQFGAEVCNVTLVCIPASSGEKNEIRYKAFAEEVARLTGCRNAYKAITMRVDGLPSMRRKRPRRCRRWRSSSLTSVFSRVRNALYSMIY